MKVLLKIFIMITNRILLMLVDMHNTKFRKFLSNNIKESVSIETSDWYVKLTIKLCN